MLLFEPTLQAAQARLDAVNPAAYARTRNALDGAVTRLSPYLTHGLLSLREVYAAVNARHPLDAKHKFVFELGWRAYWRHVWEHRGDGIHQSTHQGLLPEQVYQRDVPTDVLEARTGIPVIDNAVRELYETGYLHNHARMWLASYLVHLRKVHWHTGAQWMLGHLLDGDLASNHLSWQWVAGTGSSKPYLFNADNVAKYAPAHWHSPGTAIDTSYEALDEIARRAKAVDTRFDQRRAGEGMVQPVLLSAPPMCDVCATDNVDSTSSQVGVAKIGVWHPSETQGLDVRGRDIYLHHPWSLGLWASGHSASCPPPALRAPPLPTQSTPSPTLSESLEGGNSVDALHIGVGFDTCHANTPLSERRWNFVTRGLQAHTQHLWWGSASQIAAALQGARSVQWQSNPHADAALANVRDHLRHSAPELSVHVHRTPCLFVPVEVHCRSFSEWWKRTRIA